MTTATAEVLLPTSPEEAVEAFGDGSEITVVGGGTIVMPELSCGRLRPTRVLSLARSGLDQITRANGVVTIGAATPISALVDGDEPLASAARHVGDPEIRARATVGGNLCAAPGAESPRGDLQAPLLTLAARARSAGAGGERTEPLEEFLARGAGRLLLDISYDDVPRSAGYAAAWRPHAHHYTILAAVAVRAGGETRVAVTGAAPTGVRCPAVESAVAEGRSGAEAAQRALDDVGSTLADDALASVWYRSRILPTLVARALESVAQEAR
jgi:carbon-monoxide dehydrogenase medium subunit